MSNPRFLPTWIDETLVTGTTSGLVVKTPELDFIPADSFITSLFDEEELSEIYTQLGFGTVVDLDSSDIAAVDHLHDSTYEAIDDTILRTTDIDTQWSNDSSKLVSAGAAFHLEQLLR